ncbi:ABC transporter substrate-binding protein [Oscillatoria salina]|uniref:ABC transporter substrate-binding protein n=1 Tax=Oscillatoria salina TaxID=331517 RepID=UPI0013B947EF|nr:ABC transporter substrate-binding protein [Oscillatoria salina]MBZ8180130.1 carbohydrate ABC transporter substrate-binding protein [Oscillatoria salina IIICB1]NET90756.1 carbohydrate ABC transporter substrate-binding protein [Kamptonema sp. SIO1D9]
MYLKKLNVKKFSLSIFLLIILIATIVFGCQNSSEQVDKSYFDSAETIERLSLDTGVLTIWWDKGFIEEEKTFFQKIVNDWEKQQNKKVQLVFFDENQLVEQIEAAVAAGNPPDLTIDRTQLALLYAWEDKLVDVSSTIAPVADFISDSALENAQLFNQVEQKKSYYAVPLYQEAVYLHYWRDWLEELGYSPQDIPQDWDGFWEFWTQLQERLRSEQQQEIFSLGFPSSPYSTETFFLFEYILEAYNVQVVDEAGQLVIEQQENRQGLVEALKWWSELYQEGYIPPSALVWRNEDNNSSFYNRIMAITANPSLSIPAARFHEKDLYLNKLATIEFPRKPDGQPMRYLIEVRQALIFKDSPNQKDAKSFLSYLIEPTVLDSYIEAADGRFFPVNTSGWNDPFWTNADDPHITEVKKIMTQSPTRPYSFSTNPGYVEALEENVWGEALYGILVEGISPEKAAKNAIAQFQEFFADWQ